MVLRHTASDFAPRYLIFPAIKTKGRVKNGRYFSRASRIREFLASAGLGASQKKKCHFGSLTTHFPREISIHRTLYISSPPGRGVTQRFARDLRSTAKNTVLVPARHRVVYPPCHPPATPPAVPPPGEGRYWAAAAAARWAKHGVCGGELQLGLLLPAAHLLLGGSR